MHGQSIFGLSSLHSLYSLISKRCYTLMVQWRKTCLIFQAKMISLQLEWHITYHTMAITSFWGQKYIDSWDLTSRLFWGRPRPHFKVFSNGSDSIFIQSYCQNDQEMVSVSSVQAWPQRLIWRLLRLGLVNDWILRLMHKFHH